MRAQEFITEEKVLKLPNGNWIVYKDHGSKSWYGFKIDAEENQMGEALFAYRKRDLLNNIKMMPDDYGTEEY